MKKYTNSLALLGLIGIVVMAFFVLREFVWGYFDSIIVVVISPDNKHVVTGSCCRSIRVWDMNTGQLSHTLEEYADFLNCGEPVDVDFHWAAISPDSQRVVASLSNGSTKIWDMNTGQLLHTLVGHAARVWSVAISSDNKKVVTASDDNTAKIWDMHSGKLLHTLTGHTGGIWAMAISSDNKKVVTGSVDDTAKIWDINTGQLLHTLVGHKGGIKSLAISSDNQKIVTGSWDKTAKIWDMNTGQLLRTLQGEYDNGIISVAISSDNQNIVTAPWDGSAKIWDMNTGQLLHTLESSEVFALVITPDNKKVVGAWADIKIWGINTGKLLHTLVPSDNYYFSSIAVSFDSQKVVSGLGDGTAEIWDINTGQLIDTLAIQQPMITINSKFPFLHIIRRKFAMR